MFRVIFVFVYYRYLYRVFLLVHVWTRIRIRTLLTLVCYTSNHIARQGCIPTPRSFGGVGKSPDDSDGNDSSRGRVVLLRPPSSSLLPPPSSLLLLPPSSSSSSPPPEEGLQARCLYDLFSLRTLYSRPPQQSPREVCSLTWWGGEHGGSYPYAQFTKLDPNRFF